MCLHPEWSSEGGFVSKAGMLRHRSIGDQSVFVNECLSCEGDVPTEALGYHHVLLSRLRIVEVKVDEVDG